MILLTLDASTESETAAAVAVDLAHRFGQPLQLLLVLDGTLRHHFAEASRASGATVDEEVEAYLAGVLSRLVLPAGVEVSTRSVHAVDAGTAIVAAAGEGDVALVVMATHGRSGLSRLLAGSVTVHVVRSSPVPVVVVPAG